MPQNTAIIGLSTPLLVSSAVADEDDFGDGHDIPQFALLWRDMPIIPKGLILGKDGKSEQDVAYLDTQK